MVSFGRVYLQSVGMLLVERYLRVLWQVPSIMTVTKATLSKEDAIKNALKLTVFKAVFFKEVELQQKINKTLMYRILSTKEIQDIDIGYLWC